MLVYALMALAANWPTLPGNADDMRQGDMTQMTWYLAWTPHQILHGNNPFYTTALNYPSGINLAQNTSAPLLGLLAAPLTLSVNPIASLNLLLWLAFPLSASSMYFALRRFVTWQPAAFLGGALYGFSPHVVGQSFNHLNLAFVPLPPLILLAAYELLRPGAARRRQWGMALGLLVTAQFFISPEIAATTVIAGVLGCVIVACAHGSEVAATVRRSAPAVGIATAIIAVFLAYPAWFMLSGPHRYNGPAYRGGLRADLLGTVTPTTMQRFHSNEAVARGSSLLNGNIPENGSYLSWPLVALAVLMAAIGWRHALVRLSAAMAVLLTIVSLGPTLVADNEDRGIYLPGALLNLDKLPLLDNVLVTRFSLYVAMFVAVIVAVGFDDICSRLRAGQTAQRSRRSLKLPACAALAAALTALSIIALIPRWPFTTSPSNVPVYFSSSAVERIPEGSVVLISPYPSVAEVLPQLWQAVAGIRFRIIGGYGLVADSEGNPSNFPDILEPRSVQTFLWAKATGGDGYPVGPVPTMGPQLVCDFQTFLVANDVDVVLGVEMGANPHDIDELFTAALGAPSETVEEVKAWYGISPQPSWCAAALAG
ncbi:MAG: hypothetical protein JWN61_2674 [Pseudonocardiales bacterium]|nr:hypothetical protein [Pseudonocardiales bacterium]